MAQQKYAEHERLEIHEMITVKSACAVKSAMMQGFASDKKLKRLLEEDVKVSQQAITELKEILEKAK
ncbi:hypothetical protein M3212_19245 [Alkalihalobacillus oceani]|uniref:hypothetical protein n=1 Tax=Halalkalibacter oceani TaxID=1653776 RepID=UPI002041B798|nr:hypothetical protein [Halalkalibacter oceani]MCM3762881.1 hypothetical protein [Halalkalibacter oceani]